MRADRYLTKPQQYAFVHQKGRSCAADSLVMKSVSNGLPVSRYGFSVSKKVGNAVTRNRVKRWLREIMRVLPLKAGYDIVFVARAAAATSGYWKIRKTVEGLLLRCDLLEAARSPGTLAEVKPAGERGGDRGMLA